MTNVKLILFLTWWQMVSFHAKKSKSTACQKELYTLKKYVRALKSLTIFFQKCWKWSEILLDFVH